MTQPNGLADKGAIEEWVDLRFFRPAGLLVVRAVWPFGVTADQLTLAAVVLGVIAGHLFFYDSILVNSIGLALFIISDIFDSSDGQMARLRGTSTRFGRVLDGMADSLRFISLYGHLLARLVTGGAFWVGPAVFVALAAWAHTFQSQGVDFIRNAYLRVAANGGELDQPEDVVIPPGLKGLGAKFYRDYLRHQARLFPTTTALARALKDQPTPPALQAEWRKTQLPIVKACPLIAQNIRFPLMIAIIVHMPSLFLFATAVLGSLVLGTLVWQTEKRAKAAMAKAGFVLPKAGVGVEQVA